MTHSVLCLALVAASGLVGAEVGTPIDRVITLLGKLRNQVQNEGAAEAAGYDKYACFCKEQTNSKTYAIEKSAQRLAALGAAIEELGGRIAELDTAVAARKTELAKERSEATAAAKTQAEVQATYEAKRADLVQAIDALARAIDAMQSSKKEVQNVAFLAMDKALAKLHTKRSWEAPTAVSFKYQSDDVIATLQGLTKTFKAELADLDESHGVESHDFAMVEGARANKMRAFEAEINKKEALSASLAEEKAEKEGASAEETSAKAADQAFLDTLVAGCDEKAKAWDIRSKTRATEITTITEALSILNGMGNLYDVNTKLTDLVAARQHVTLKRPLAHGHWVWVEDAETRSGSSPAFVQLHSAHSTKRWHSVVGFLERAAHALKSQKLNKLAQEVQAEVAEDHFAKVRAIIKDLVARLEAEALDEADQKAFCDKAMKEAITNRDTKKNEMEGFAAEIDETKAKIAQLTEDITALSEALAGLHKALNEMTELRAAEKAQNAKTLADAQEGASAVRQAVEVLKKFYDSAALVQYVPPNSDRQGQTVGDLAPETFEGEYKGRVDTSKGVIGMLEVIASDFERTATTTEEAEAAAQAAFEKAEAETLAEIKAKETEKADKESEKESSEANLTELQDNLQDATALHASALEELEKLKPACVDAAETWEERKKRREEEIEALKEAMRILEEWKN